MGNRNICLFIDDCAGLASIRIRIRFDSIPRRVDSRIPEVYKNLNRMLANRLCRYVSFESIFFMAVDRAEGEKMSFSTQIESILTNTITDPTTQQTETHVKTRVISLYGVLLLLRVDLSELPKIVDRAGMQHPTGRYALLSADANRHRLHNPNPNHDPCPLRWHRCICSIHQFQRFCHLSTKTY